MTPGSARAVVLRITCARDGREYLVADEAMTAGSAGRYVALCGHGVWAAALACPSGPPCPACIAARRAGMADERHERHPPQENFLRLCREIDILGTLAPP